MAFITKLPPEILLKVFSYLTHGDLTQTALCCREWYYFSTDPVLWRDLSLTAVRSELFPTIHVAGTLADRTRLCRTFRVDTPQHLSVQHLCILLRHLAFSPYLETLELVSVPGIRSHNYAVDQFFSSAITTSLVHVNLSRSAIATPPVVSLINRHHATLQTLLLEFSSIGDGALRAIANASQLKKLTIGGCFSLSKTGVRAFLTKRVPKNLEHLEMRWLLDVRIGWMWDMFIAQKRDGGKLAHIDVCGCEKLGKGDLERLTLGWQGTNIVHSATGGRETEIGLRRWREAFGALGELGEKTRSA